MTRSVTANDRALFLDRDGTIVVDHGYIRDPELVEPIPGAVETLAKLASENWKLVLVSNQAGIARGIISREEAAAVQARFMELMRAGNVPFAGVYICHHAPEEGCRCRKPSPYFLLCAAREHSLDLTNSWMIGDKPADVGAGRSAGCSTVWIRNATHAAEHEHPTFIADSWEQIDRKLSCES